MTDADRERLILDNLSLAWWCIHRYFRRLPGATPDTEDDLLQEARIGLIEAARTFDPDRGTRFATHAVWRIRGRVQNAVRKWKTTPVPHSPADPVFDSLTDDYPSALEMLIAAEEDAILTDALDCLPAREAHVLRERWLHGRTLDEVSADLGVCKERVRQIQRQAEERLAIECPHLGSLV